jgi:4a-hydroxytetrahydrobiopterin dehydratase
MNPPLGQLELTFALAGLPGWAHENNALTKTFVFAGFRDAISFMVRVSIVAEAMDHHLDWTNARRRVVIRLTTHDAGHRVTTKDVELARKIENVARVD